MVTIRLRRLVVLLASFVFCLGAMLAPASAGAQATPTQGVDDAPLFINVTSDDPWKVAMAAFFGTNFALKQGHKPVLIFVNVQATPLFTKAKSTLRAEQFGRTVHEMLKDFQAAGGRILICPVCMKALSITDSDLIDGAEVATAKSVNDVLFRPQTKTLAW